MSAFGVRADIFGSKATPRLQGSRIAISYAGAANSTTHCRSRQGRQTAFRILSPGHKSILTSSAVLGARILHFLPSTTPPDSNRACFLRRKFHPGMKTKSQQIREALTAGDRIGALRIAAHFHDRSTNTMAYKRGFDAYNNSDFYRQLGQDPQQLVAVAINLLQKRF